MARIREGITLLVSVSGARDFGDGEEEAVTSAWRPVGADVRDPRGGEIEGTRGLRAADGLGARCAAREKGMGWPRNVRKAAAFLYFFCPTTFSFFFQKQQNHLTFDLKLQMSSNQF